LALVIAIGGEWAVLTCEKSIEIGVLTDLRATNPNRNQQ
jgi:hypothetical protein